MKKNKADISVIFPYYNEEETLLKTLELISEQTLKPTEVIFVNSSSTDSSSEIIDNWIREEDPKSIKFKNCFEGTNTPSSSKNVGIKSSNCEWIAFMDCGLLFERNWLEKQWTFLQKNQVEIVSGVVILEGKGLIDASAVAQTYGYKRPCPCMPSTVMKKSLFKKTGFFEENRRAGYDVSWQLKLMKLGVQRGINNDVVIRYSGVNFGNRFTSILKKSINYATASVGLPYYKTPYWYLAISFFAIITLFVAPNSLLWYISAYVLLRGIIIPAKKSKGLEIFQTSLFIMLFLPLVGFFMDAGRTIGFLRGVFRYHSWPKK